MKLPIIIVGVVIAVVASYVLRTGVGLLRFARKVMIWGVIAAVVVTAAFVLRNQHSASEHNVVPDLSIPSQRDKP